MDRTEAASDARVAAALDWAAQQPGWWHDSGNLNVRVLQAIASHGARIGAKETVETGCGLSTVVLSALAECHTCFTVAFGNSLERVQNVPHLRSDRVNFIIGPSQLTLPRHSFTRPLDLVLIDGPHGFPFAHMEYFYFYQRVRKGGVLVVDDIHIPTVRQMYDVLRDDAMWTHLEDVLTTAFFQRTDAPLFDPFGDGWERQRFNQRHFQDPSLLDTYAAGWREAMTPPPGPLLGQDPGHVAASGNAATPGSSGGESHAEMARLRAEIARLRAENEAMHASTSWRLTAPLRALASGVRPR